MPLKWLCDYRNCKNPENLQVSGKISQDFRFQQLKNFEISKDFRVPEQDVQYFKRVLGPSITASKLKMIC